jgi:hypothetical protein
VNYKLVEGENKKIFYVKETNTDLIIEAFKDFSEARKFMRHLNLGGGFDGFTPQFMVYKKSKLLNKNSKNM